jgi:UDP-N-acetylmuramoyl-tripeptide--D-alanyl-D-alanine ligase
MGMSTAAVVRGLARGARAPHRSTLVQAGDWLILDDSYNAAPDSMTAALALLAELPGRRIAVLGEMRELGDESEAAHRAVGRTAATTADLLVVPGAAAAPIADGAREAGMAPDAVVVTDDRDAARDALLERLRPGDVVLVKASRGVELDRLVGQLTDAARTGSPA